MSKYSEYWDLTVKPLAKEVIDNAKFDKGAIEHYVGGMIFAVEHDLADDRRGMLSLNSLSQVSGVFSSDSYFEKVHPTTPKEETDRLRKLSTEIKKLMEIEYD